MYAYIENKHFFSKSCHRQTYQNYEQPIQSWQKFVFYTTKFKGLNTKIEMKCEYKWIFCLKYDLDISFESETLYFVDRSPARRT